MEYLNLIILATVGSLLSLIGGFVLLSNKKQAHKIADYGAPFAAGALIAAALVDLLPEAINNGSLEPRDAGIWAMAGMAIFFLLERKLNWFHHHHEHKAEAHEHKPSRTPTLLVIGDTIHNAIDGAAIAIAYLADPSLGVITTFAVALHEVPQEIGDFSLLLKAGWERKRIIIVNILSAVATIISALLVYQIGSSAESVLPMLLAFTAGILLYIAASDVIPGVHGIKAKGIFKDYASLLFIAGLAVVTFAVILAESNVE